MVILYVLQGDNGKRYVGITNDLNRRLDEHQSGKTKASHLLGRIQLLMTEEYDDYPTARKREMFLKSGQGRAWLDARIRILSPRPFFCFRPEAGNGHSPRIAMDNGNRCVGISKHLNPRLAAK